MEGRDNGLSSLLGLAASNPAILGSLASLLGGQTDADGKETSGGEADPDALRNLLQKVDVSKLVRLLSPLLAGRTPASVNTVPDTEGIGFFTDDGEREQSAASVGTGAAPDLSGEPNGEKEQTSFARDAAEDAFGDLLGKKQGSPPAGKRSGGVPLFLPGPPDKRLALLIALKPYLSPHRAEAVDTMVRFGKIGEMLEGLMSDVGKK